MNIIKEELQFEENLKQRLEFICEFSKVTPKFINGSIRKIEKTNFSYIEPHRVIIKNTTFLIFNYSNDVYISNLSKKIYRLDRVRGVLRRFRMELDSTDGEVLMIRNVNEKAPGTTGRRKTRNKRR